VGRIFVQFLVDTGDVTIQKEMEVSLKAGELVGRLYDALLRQYDNPDSEETLKNLNALCVRLVFCLYAEDAGIFGRHDAFYLYIKKFNVQNVRTGLIELFRMLDTKPGGPRQVCQPGPAGVSLRQWRALCRREHRDTAVHPRHHQPASGGLLARFQLERHQSYHLRSRL
jgi:hypothetical protein